MQTSDISEQRTNEATNVKREIFVCTDLVPNTWGRTICVYTTLNTIYLYLVRKKMPHSPVTPISATEEIRCEKQGRYVKGKKEIHTRGYDLREKEVQKVVGEAVTSDLE